MALPALSTKSRIILFLFVAAIAAFAYLFFSRSKLGSAPTWRNIQVGSDTKEEVIGKLGSPLSATTSAAGWEQLDFQSTNQYWPHEVFFQKDKSTLVRERLLDPKSGELQTYITQYGSPDEVMNNSLSGLEFYLHVFASSGIAVNANPSTGTVFEVWYFPPTTLEKFKQTYATEIGYYPEQNENRY